jgi:hypothetical protein
LESNISSLAGARPQAEGAHRTGGEKTDKIFLELKGDYARIVSDLEQLWKKHHAKRDPG